MDGMRLNNLKEAYEYFINKLILRNIKIKKVYKKEFAYFIHTEYNKYCLTFKREFYHNFKYHTNIKNAGWGQIANKKLVTYCANFGYILIIVMPNGNIYGIDGKKFIKYYLKFKTDVPYLDGEIAISLKELSRLFI